MGGIFQGGQEAAERSQRGVIALNELTKYLPGGEDMNTAGLI